MDQRIEVTEAEIAESLRLLKEGLEARLAKKGRKCFIGLHEIDGTVDEEVREFKDEVRANDRRAAADELVDVAVGCVFGVASLMSHRRHEAAAGKA